MDRVTLLERETAGSHADVLIDRANEIHLDPALPFVPDGAVAEDREVTRPRVAGVRPQAVARGFAVDVITIQADDVHRNERRAVDASDPVMVAGHLDWHDRAGFDPIVIVVAALPGMRP